MSGILGVYHPDDRAVKREHLIEMSATIAHRGPDGLDFWCQENVGLGHLMLWTTPESLEEKLPFSDNNGNYVITADARIDNREELISLLKLENRTSSIADSEIVLAAYQKWGQDCPSKLLGDFAFAIWNSTTKSLFCARDHFGVKPFYYLYQPEVGFVFASEIKALFVYPGVKRQLNRAQIADFLELDFSDRVTTSYKNILRLPPAHYCIVSSQGFKAERYWSLDPHREIKLNSDREYAEAFKEIFTEAVRCRLRSAFPVGSHLSGGLDSSSVTCVARKLLSEQNNLPLHTFSNIFDDVIECDERKYINRILEQGGLTPHYVHADRFKPLSNLENFWKYEDEAYAFPSYHYLWSLNQVTQKAGVRIVLDGFDGDSVVWHGFERIAELASKGEWQQFVLEVKYTAKNYGGSASAIARQYGLGQLFNLVVSWNWFAVTTGIRQMHLNFGFSRKEIVLKYIFQPFWNDFKHKFFGQNREVTDSSLSIENSIHRDDNQKYYREQDREQKIVLNSISKEQHYQNLNDSDGVTSIAFEQADKCSSPYSVEMRHPFFDKRLVEFCLALPAEQKLYHGFGRVVMRRALEGILPNEVQWRGDKTSMTPNFLNSIVNLDRKLLDRVVFDENCSLKKHIKTDLLKEAYRQVTSNKYSEDLHNVIVWRVVTLSMWLNHNKLLL